MASRRKPPGVPPRSLAEMDPRQAFRLLDRLWAHVMDSYEGLPMEHAETHQGGSDDLTGTSDPTPITFDAEGDPGDGSEGFAPMNHTHDTTALSELEPLVGVATDTVFGAQVLDVKLVRLLEKILVELEEIRDLQNKGRRGQN